MRGSSCAATSSNEGSMNIIAEILISLLLIAAGSFGLIGSFGLVKLSNPMSRLHAPTKATTLGVGGVLIASMAHSFFELGIFSFHELLITIFLFMTAPITANFLAKVHLHLNESERTIPPTATGAPWIGYSE